MTALHLRRPRGINPYERNLLGSARVTWPHGGIRRTRAINRSREPRLCRGLPEDGCLFSHACGGLGGSDRLQAKLGVAGGPDRRLGWLYRGFLTAVVDLHGCLSTQRRRQAF